MKQTESVITKESSETEAQLRKKTSSIEEHDSRLRNYVRKICENKGFSQTKTNQAVKAAEHRFVISEDNEIRPLSRYRNLDDLINSLDGFRTEKAKLLADEESKKEELFQLLEYYANIGNMKAYRKVRSEYAKL